MRRPVPTNELNGAKPTRRGVMPATGSGPGKTAPKLLHDFLAFDALRSVPNCNYLTDHTPPVGEGVQLNPPQGSCKHEYTPKWTQSVAPPLNSQARAKDQYKIAAICKKCRIHTDLHIIYPYATNPCPSEGYPLHHFQRFPAADYQTQERIAFAWQCTAPECGAQLRVAYRRPWLDPADKDLLTDTEKLRRRYDAVVNDDPEREGIRQATPIEALTRLRRYIKDALNPEHTKRTFPANNKRFMEAFGLHGHDCADLLKKLGFTYADDLWTLPQPEVLDDRLRAGGDSQREMLEDVEMELVAWVFKTAMDTGAVNPLAGEGWPSADRDIERLLAAQGYTRHMSLRRAGVSNEELPYFASLGALHDFADHLIEFTFDRQSLCDPERRPYYFECLQVIAETRNTEQLQIKVATLASEELVSRRDLAAAYRTFSTSPSDEDERIENLYHVHISDAGPGAQEDARQALYKIGVARGSQRLIRASQQAMDTYEEALNWLGNGVDKSTPDEMLVSVAAMKIADNKSNQEQARKAISIIANARKSDALNSWCLNGGMGEYQMTTEEALRHLGVSDDLSQIDPTVLPAMFDLARSDRPGEQTEKAIATLQRAMAGGSSGSHSPETWPVGLESHGNTCYLNSLLQYYFCVAPLRDIIMNFDDYKFDTVKKSVKPERVGYLRVSMIEIKGGQRFAKDLKHLFERMIKSSSSKVKPEQDLVCRAFLDPKEYELLETRVENNDTTKGPQTNGIEHAVDDKMTDESDHAVNSDDRHQSDASSVTLQASSENGDGQDLPMQDAALPMTPPDSGEEDKEEKTAVAPPLPPRRFSTTKEAKDKALLDAQAKATAQQDVFDVHAKIMWRLQAAMESTGRDDYDEQKDAIRDLFDICFTETLVENGVQGTPVEKFDTSIQLGGFKEDTDLYSMLDANMDLQQAEGEETKTKGKQVYRSLRSLPPLLQINIPRIVPDDKGQGQKSTACIKLEDELYLDRYCEQSGSEVLEKRRACWGWRKELHALKKEQKALSSSVADLDGPSAVNEAANYLSNLSNVNDDLKSIGMEEIDFDSEVATTLAADAEMQKKRLNSLDDRIRELEAQLKDQFHEKQIKYRLAVVMFHRGASSHGHYWTYIHDFEKDIWRLYNDERVEEHHNVADILEARTWEQGTPTYAVYVQEDRKTDIIQPVCRSPEKPPTPEPSETTTSGWEDVTMANGESQAGQPPAGSVDPKSTVIETEGNWDEPRKAPQVNCTVVFKDNGAPKFILRRKDAGMRPAAAERSPSSSPSTSPKRRHDSTSADDDQQGPKHRRLSKVAEENEAVERLVEGIDEAQLDGAQQRKDE